MWRKWIIGYLFNCRVVARMEASNASGTAENGSSKSEVKHLNALPVLGCHVGHKLLNWLFQYRKCVISPKQNPSTPAAQWDFTCQCPIKAGMGILWPTGLIRPFHRPRRAQMRSTVNWNINEKVFRSCAQYNCFSLFWKGAVLLLTYDLSRLCLQMMLAG